MKRAFQTQVVGAAAVGIPQLGTYIDGAVITVENAAIRFTVDGTVPTATIGHTMGIGDTIFLEGRDDVIKFKAIRAGGVDGLLQITYTEGSN